jgi:DNA replication protein DnaC
MNPIRQRAWALLDALKYREPGDVTLDSVAQARRYRDSMVAKRYPLDALEWVWADAAKDEANPQPGELNRREYENGSLTAFGAMFDWFGKETSGRGTMAMSGDTGSGKNVAAVYAAVRKGGAYYLATRLGDLALGDNPRLRELARVPLLVLDELGRENTIGATQSRMVGLLTERHDDRLATLITTNLPPVQFGERYGKHLLDRIQNSGGYIELKGESRRRKGERPNHSMIRRHCRIADLAEAVETLTGVGRSAVSDSVIDELAEIYGITEEQFDAMIEQRRTSMAVPERLLGGLLEKVLRVANGEAEPPKERKHAAKD